MVNRYTHLYLYAKGYYLERDLLDDLKTIVAEYAHIKKQFVSLEDVRSLLTAAAMSEMQRGNFEYLFPKFIKEILGYSEDTLYIQVFRALLNILTLSLVKGIDLGQANPSLLPLTKTGTESILRT